MDKRLDDIKEKIDAIKDDVNDIKVTQAEQNLILKEHMRRTELLEEIVEPMKKHIDGLHGVIKLVKVLGILAGIAEVLHVFRVF